jgi:hypothetical protein
MAMLAEAVHTAFRKGSSHPSANTIWHEIQRMPAEEWGKVMTWCHWSLFYAKKQARPKVARAKGK